MFIRMTQAILFFVMVLKSLSPSLLAPGLSRLPEGNMSGHLSQCPRPSPTCWWQGCWLAPATSSVSCLRTNWALDPSVKSPLSERRVSTSFNWQSTLSFVCIGHWSIFFVCTSLILSCLSSTALPTDPPTVITTLPTIDPPSFLSANQTVLGIVLQWYAPESQATPLTGYVLQARRNKGQWVILNSAVKANQSELLVQGLLRVRGNYNFGPWQNEWRHWLFDKWGVMNCNLKAMTSKH